MNKAIVTLATLLTVLAVNAASTPVIVSSQVRANDPTVLDVVYRVTSDKPTVNVRALAFEDGERSLWKVVRPETFIDGTAVNLGDNIAAKAGRKYTADQLKAGDFNGNGQLDNADYFALRALLRLKGLL